MKSHLLLPVAALLVLILVACGPSAATQASVPASPEANVSGGQPAQSAAPAMSAWPETVQVDEQGAIVVEITPRNLNTATETLDFDVAINTHSVDLGMDLAQLATLVTDNGRTVKALAWNAPQGGHHVSGILTFPAVYDGKPLLEGATQFTIYIAKVDADMRLFTWALSK